MKTLHKLQQEFVKALTTASDIIQHIHPHPKVTPTQQFSIYQNAFMGRFQKTLKNIYPVCYKLLGEDFFLAMAREYILQTPSCSPDLNYYGESFPIFIAGFPPAKSLPYLADLGRLEWAWHYIYAAANMPGFNFEKLAARYASHAETILFLLPSRCSLLASPYPVHRIWEANQENASPTTDIILAADEMYYFIVWRKAFDLHIDLLTATQWQILSFIQQKLNLGEICEQNLPDINIAETLAHFVSAGWIAGFQ